MAEPATRRELLEKAWDDAEAKAESEAAEEKEEVKASSESEEPETGGEEPTGSVVDESEKDKKIYDTERKVANDRGKPAAAHSPPPDEKPAVNDEWKAPPNAWKANTREKWAALPAEVREEITRRETHIQQTLSQTDRVRQFAQEFAQIVQPYQHIIQQQGSTPLKAVGALMGLAAKLTTGSEDQKAEVLAELIGNYRVDLKTLDRVLSGKVGPDGRVPQQAKVPEGPPEWARPMFDFMGEVQRSRQELEQRQTMEAQAEVQRIASKPHFEDVREEMADIMEVAARRGISMKLEDAYDRALSIKGIKRTVVAAHTNSVSAAAATLARARRAASTVTGAPGGDNVGGRPTPKTRREMIAQAWEDQENSV